jgi:histone H3/H4
MAKKIFAWSPIRNLGSTSETDRRLMKDNGAEMVARDAVDSLIDYLEKLARKTTNRALEMTRHAGRKKLTIEDMEMAIELQE